LVTKWEEPGLILIMGLLTLVAGIALIPSSATAQQAVVQPIGIR
jgi:p-aminobenzoyl-glutamate transporter AbgT